MGDKGCWHTSFEMQLVFGLMSRIVCAMIYITCVFVCVALWPFVQMSKMTYFYDYLTKTAIVYVNYVYCLSVAKAEVVWHNKIRQNLDSSSHAGKVSK